MKGERSPASFDVIVIGAGQAGLAIGYFLLRAVLARRVVMSGTGAWGGTNAVRSAWRRQQLAW